ncbi:MAG: glycosyltransferase, partial [Acidobacteria bacterium]|nr:glycosyltransferase [Acidobacteriota bacterium]
MSPGDALRVLHLDDGRGWRGGQQQVSFLLREQARAGHLPVLICPPGQPLGRWARERGIQVHEGPLASGLRPSAITAVRRAMAATRPHVVHAHTSSAHTLALLAARGRRRPLRVVTRRLARVPGASPVARWKYGEAVDLFIAVSRAVRRDLVAGGVRPDRVVVAPSAIDPARFTSPPSRQVSLAALGLPPEARLIGTLGSLVRQKNQSDLVAAFGLLAPGHPRLHLVILGEGPLRGDLEAQVERLGLSGRVHLPGFRDDAGDLLPHWDLAALPSLYEGMPNAVLDALAAGVPVVATPAGGAAEILMPGAGRMVPFHAPARLAGAMDWMLEHPEAGRDMARKGRQRVLAGHVPEVMAASVEEGYRQALARRRRDQGRHDGIVQVGPARAWGRDSAVGADLVRRAAAREGLPLAGPPPGGTGTGGRAQVLRTSLGGCRVVFKMHRRGGLPGKLSRFLPGDVAGLFAGPGKARRAVKVATAFRARGGVAPEPVGWLAVRRGLMCRVYAAAAELIAARTLDQVLAAGSSRRRAQLLTALGKALARWHHAGLVHRDLNAGNLLLVASAGRAPTAEDFAVIDLESARLCRRPSRRARAAALARLERSLLKVMGKAAPGLREGLRVLGAYGLEWALLEARPPHEAASLVRGLLKPLARHRRLHRCHGVRAS